MDPYNFEGYGQDGISRLERRWRRRRLLLGGGAILAIVIGLLAIIF